MNLFGKTVFVSVINALCSGFFGLGTCFINYFWLDWIQQRYPRVQDDLQYQAKFGLGCAAAVFVILTIRQFRASFMDRIIRLGELVALVILACLGIVWFTPTPGTCFVRHVMEKMVKRSSSSVYEEDRNNPYQHPERFDNSTNR